MSTPDHPVFQEILDYRCPRYEELPIIPLYSDQVIDALNHYTAPFFFVGDEQALTPAMINNYVKTGLIHRPLGKKYYREHLALLMMIVTLKPVASMDDIARLIAPREGLGIRELYEEFQRTQLQVFRSISIDPNVSALQHAVTATAYRLVTESLLTPDALPAEK